MTINRENYTLVQKYLKYRSDVDRLSEESLRLEYTWLLHYLFWADKTSFVKAAKISPHFLVYLETARLDASKSQPFSHEYSRKILRGGNKFFRWLKTREPGFSSLSENWIDTLRLPNTNRSPKSAPLGKAPRAITIEEIMQIANAPVENIYEMRTRAAAVFLFLSGMRVTAFTTLPLRAVDIPNQTVYQWPSLGVRTKFRKEATTFLLPITDLLQVILDWDNLVRDLLPGTAPWYAQFSPKTRELDLQNTGFAKDRASNFRGDLLQWLTKVKLPFHSPHKFRHGHAIWLLMRASDIADFKACSQNLMHDDLSTTDGIYGNLSSNDVRNRILTMSNCPGIDQKGMHEQIAALLDQLTHMHHLTKEQRVLIQLIRILFGRDESDNLVSVVC